MASQDFVSQEQDTQYEDLTLDVDDKGLLDPTTRKGRSVNYTIDEDKLFSLAWKQIGLDVVVGSGNQ